MEKLREAERSVTGDYPGHSPMEEAAFLVSTASCSWGPIEPVFPFLKTADHQVCRLCIQLSTCLQYMAFIIIYEKGSAIG